MQELQNIDNQNKAAPLEEYLSNWSTENTLYQKKRENQSDEDEKVILDVMPNQTNLNLNIIPIPMEKTPREHPKEGSDISFPELEGDLDSNFDSPYHGDDKFCLDILGKLRKIEKENNICRRRNRSTPRVSKPRGR